MIRWLLMVMAFLIFSLTYGTCSSDLDSSSVSKQVVKNFAIALLSDSIQIGVFELPSLDQPPKALESGIVPQVQEGYLNLRISHNLILFNVLNKIQGEFDSVVFVKRPKVTLSPLNNYVPPQFFSYSGTTWIILLKSVIINNESKAEWVDEVRNPKNHTYINEKTLFEFATDSYGAICLKWPENIKKPVDLPIASEKLVQDLTTISTWISTAKKTGKVSESSYESIKRRMETEYGKAIWDKIKALKK